MNLLLSAVTTIHFHVLSCTLLGVSCYDKNVCRNNNTYAYIYTVHALLQTNCIVCSFMPYDETVEFLIFPNLITW